MKKIEWNKKGPGFHDLRRGGQQFGAPDDWCIEAMHNNRFISPCDSIEILGQQVTMRTIPITDDNPLGEQHEDPRFSRWLQGTFEKVIGLVGRVFMSNKSKPHEVANPTAKNRCVGTVGLMDEHGASICALHTIYDSIKDPSCYRIHIVYPNYHQGQLTFKAKVKSMDEDSDICVLEPSKPLTKPWIPLTYLDLAADANEGDFVYCFFYPKDPLKHQTPDLYKKIIKPEKPTRIWRALASSSMNADHPIIISGNICFSEWMQGVATYNHLPDPNGGLLVSRSGRLKGIHVKAFTCGDLQDFAESKNPEEMRIAKKLCKTMSSYAPSEPLPVFVPPHGLVRMLMLQRSSEPTQVALLKVQMHVENKGEPQKNAILNKRKLPFSMVKKLIEKKPKK